MLGMDSGGRVCSWMDLMGVSLDLVWMMAVAWDLVLFVCSPMSRLLDSLSGLCPFVLRSSLRMHSRLHLQLKYSPISTSVAS